MLMPGPDEEEVLKEEIEVRKDLMREKKDDPDDITHFELALINTKNKALVIDCAVIHGHVIFNKVMTCSDEGLKRSQQTWLRKLQSQRSAYFGPRFETLSEPVQTNLVEYLYEVGLHPEIGLAVEYLSWNKEQRLYMEWLKNTYMMMCSPEKAALWLAPIQDKLEDKQ